MKRFHVNLAVDDLAQSVRFYSTLFATEPTVLKPDYAKWMLEDPRVNFSISTASGRRPGISHLGIQAEDQGELAEIYGRLADAQGVEWETFYTYGESTVYGTSSADVRTGALGGGILTCGCGPSELQELHAEAATAGACCAD